MLCFHVVLYIYPVVLCISKFLFFLIDYVIISPLYSGNPYTGSLENSEDPDEMQHHAAFHQVLHCLPRLKQTSGTEIHKKKPTCYPLKYTMGLPILIVSICMGKSYQNTKG